jgi:hypothetical protein
MRKAEAVSKLDEPFPPLRREADARRVLMIGDRVEHFRSQPPDELPPELLDVKPTLVHRHGDDVRFEAAEGHDRAEVRRALDNDGVAAVEKGHAGQLERLDRAAGDQQFVVARPPALLSLEPLRNGAERAGQPSRRRILECGRFACGCELGQQRRSPFARKGERIRKSARERDQVGASEKRQDVRDSFADIAAGACSKELFPAWRLARDRHHQDYRSQAARVIRAG